MSEHGESNDESLSEGVPVLVLEGDDGLPLLRDMPLACVLEATLVRHRATAAPPRCPQAHVGQRYSHTRLRPGHGQTGRFHVW